MEQHDAASRLREALVAAGQGLVERESLVQLIGLAAVAGEHLLVIGPPGTAKSEAARRVARALGGSYFEYLLGRFTEPTELFGSVDLRKLKEGLVETHTAGMLPEAEIAFLDEVFLGSTAILNTLLALLNERVFRRGHSIIQCPLRLCVGASNALPEDESLEAFADRFLVRVFLQPVADTRLEDLLEARAPQSSSEHKADLAILDSVAARASAVDLSGIRGRIAQSVRELRSAGVLLTDRRVVKAQRLIAAAAAVDGRDRATEKDLWPLLFAVPTQQGQRLARDVLRETLAASENRTLAAAAEEASAGPAARASRLVHTGASLLAEAPADPAAKKSWKLKLEGIAREIDAGFSPDGLPPELAQIRARIVEAVRP